METNPKEQQRRRLYMKAARVSMQFAAIILIPLIIFGSLGKWLDAHYHTKYFILIGVVLALAASSAWCYKVILDIYNDLKR